MKFEIPYTEEEKEALRHCELCPRKCGVTAICNVSIAKTNKSHQTKSQCFTLSKLSMN